MLPVKSIIHHDHTVGGDEIGAGKIIQADALVNGRSQVYLWTLLGGEQLRQATATGAPGERDPFRERLAFYAWLPALPMSRQGSLAFVAACPQLQASAASIAVCEWGIETREEKDKERGRKRRRTRRRLHSQRRK
jgi:hypothetical protein